MPCAVEQVFEHHGPEPSWRLRQTKPASQSPWPIGSAPSGVQDLPRPLVTGVPVLASGGPPVLASGALVSSPELSSPPLGPQATRESVDARAMAMNALRRMRYLRIRAH